MTEERPEKHHRHPLSSKAFFILSHWTCPPLRTREIETWLKIQITALYISESFSFVNQTESEPCFIIKQLGEEDVSPNTNEPAGDRVMRVLGP